MDMAVGGDVVDGSGGGYDIVLGGSGDDTLSISGNFAMVLGG